MTRPAEFTAQRLTPRPEEREQPEQPAAAQLVDRLEQAAAQVVNPPMLAQAGVP